MRCYGDRVTPDNLIEPVLRLRLVLVGTRDRAVRSELREIEVDLRRRLGPSVPKRAAARALGTSVQTLDSWVARGVLPAVRTASGKRLGIRTGPLLDLAVAVRQVRAEGRTTGVIAEAVRRLGWRERPAPLIYSMKVAGLPRPNVSVEELEDHYARTTGVERIREQAALNRSLRALAGRRS